MNLLKISGVKKLTGFSLKMIRDFGERGAITSKYINKQRRFKKKDILDFIRRYKKYEKSCRNIGYIPKNKIRIKNNR